MFARGTLLLVGLVLLGCPANEPPSSERDTKPLAAPPASVDPPRSSPDAAPSSDDPPLPEHVAVIEPVEGLIGTRGLPKHVDFTLANATDKPIQVVLTGVDHGGSKRTPLSVGEIQWWPSDASEPTPLTLAQALALAPGVVGQLTIYLGAYPQAAIDAGEIDAMSDRYRLIGKFRVDEVDSDVTAIVRRGTRPTMPGTGP